MRGESLAMSQKELSRLVVITRVREKTMTIKEAAEAMGTSYRQGWQVYKRHVIEGDKGLIHQSLDNSQHEVFSCSSNVCIILLRI